MDVQETGELISKIRSLDFDEKRKLYQATFSIGYVGSGNLNDRLVLISLVALVYQQMKLKDKSVTPLQLLLKITAQPKDSSSFYYFLESLALVVEDMSYEIKTIDACGLKTSQEIIKKIKEILSTWIPF